MTQQPSVPEVPGVLRRVLTGAANLMAIHSEGPTTRGTHRYDYRTAIEADRSTVAAFIRHMVERASGGKRTARAADGSLFERVPEDAVMLIVVCDAGRAEGRVTSLQPGDQLYALVVPEGNMLAVEATKQRRQRHR